MAVLPTSLQAGLAPSLALRPQTLSPETGQGLNQGLAPVALAVSRKCQTCGGSGVLRLTALRFRTCLDCAGQGILPVVPASSSFEPQPQLGQALDQLMASTRPRRIMVSSERLKHDLPL